MTNNSATEALLAIHATCPHCGYNLNVMPYTPVAGDHYDNDRGGFRTKCDSCRTDFVIATDEVRDIQATALVLLGEA